MIPLYPLRFEPIYQERPSGGRRLADLLSAPLPADGPTGGAWLLSEKDPHVIAGSAWPASTSRNIWRQAHPLVAVKLRWEKKRE